MWRTLWIAALVLQIFEGSSAFTLTAHAEAISALVTGPKYSEEAEILWKEGQSFFGQGEYARASFSLQRFVDRYPNHRNVLDAQLLLGLAYLRAEKPEQALKPLKYFIEAGSRASEAFRARLVLGRAFLKLKKYNEALLTAVEALDFPTAAKLPSEIRLEALLVKAWAQLGLGQDKNALKSRDAFQTESRGTASFPTLQTEGHRISVEIKVRECSTLPGKSKRLEEGDALKAIRERGSCLQEALLAFKPAVLAGDAQWIESSSEAIVEAFQDYFTACTTPPDPEGKHSPEELSRYRAELADRMIPECEKSKQDALSSLDNWKSGDNTAVNYAFKNLHDQLGKIYVSRR